MILIVDFNTIAEELILVKGLKLGQTQPSESMVLQPGGAGIRIARALFNLGERVTVTGFIGGKTGQSIKLLLFKEGIPFNFIEIKDDVPECKIIVDTVNHSETLILGPEPPRLPRDITQFKGLYRSISNGIKAVCFTGRIPDGFPPTAFRDLIKLHRARKTHHFVYSNPLTLKTTLAAKPFLGIIHLHDLELFVGQELPNHHTMVEAIRDQLPPALGYIGVIDHTENMALVSETSACLVRAPSPEPHLKNVGSDEAMIAGIITGQLHTNNILEAVRWGMAARFASKETSLIAKVDKARVLQILEKIECHSC